MLILKRPPGTSLTIGGGITIHFGDRNKVAIDAPSHVHIMRSELLDTDLGQPAAAATVPASATVSTETRTD